MADQNKTDEARAKAEADARAKAVAEANAKVKAEAEAEAKAKTEAEEQARKAASRGPLARFEVRLNGKIYAPGEHLPGDLDDDIEDELDAIGAV